MAKKPTADKRASAASDKEARLKAALKANLARRKAQSRGRMALDAENKTQPGTAGQDKDT